MAKKKKGFDAFATGLSKVEDGYRDGNIQVTFPIPYPPSANNRLGVSKGANAHVYKDERHVSYQASVGLYLNNMGYKTPIAWYNEDFKLAIRIDAYPPNAKKKRDTDNILKSILDSLQHPNAAVVQDDCQFKMIRVEMHPYHKGIKEMVIITIKPYQPFKLKIFKALYKKFFSFIDKFRLRWNFTSKKLKKRPKKDKKMTKQEIIDWEHDL